MKKFVYSILAAAAVLSAASCQRETQMAREQGGLVDVTFQVGLQGLQTKAFSDGTSATTLDVYVYSARTDGDVLLPNLTQQKENAFQNLTAQVTMKLVRGENYKIVFWAHAPQSPYTVDPDNATLTVTSTVANAPAPAANDELRDAFLGKFEGAVTTAVSASVELTRPFAQLNVLTTDADWDAAIANGITFAGSSMKLTAPSEMNLLTGEVSKEVAMEFAMAPITEAVNIPQYETGYKWIAMNYILAADTKTLIGEANKPFTFAVYREGQADLLFEQNLPTIPVQRNYRTVIVGDVFCVDGSFTVSIVPDYDGVLTPADTQTGADVSIIADDVTVEEGKSVSINASSDPASTGAWTYTSADESIAIVDTDGTVTGMKAGSTTITINLAAVANEFKAAEKVINVTVTAAQQAPTGITIDGNLDDWANVTNVFSTGKSRIVEWKYDSDDTNVYFLYKVAKAELPFSSGYDWAPYIYIGFDTDNDATTGSAGGASLGNGLEAQADCYPWTGSTEGSPEVLAAGENTKGIGIECPVGTNVGYVVAGGKMDSDYSYIEVSVPLAKIGNPTGQITVNHSLSWQTTGSQQITLGSGTNTAVDVTITADDVTVEESKSVSINASANPASTGAWTYTSADESIATVAADGTVTGVAAGATTITINVAEVPGQFKAAEKVINVTVTAAQQAATGITIDGDMSDWANITPSYTSVGNRINSWKYVSSADYLYLYYEVNATKIKSDGTSKFAVGFDMDMDPSTGAQGELEGAGTSGSFNITESGLEALATFYPWDGTTAVLSGELSGSSVQFPVGTTTGKVTVGGMVSSDVAYLEISIPKSAIGSPAANTHIIINTAMQFYPTGRTEIVL